LFLYALIGYWIFTAYGALYWRLSFALRRGQEYDADQIAGSIVGAAELGAALRRAQAVSAAWRDFHARYIVPMRRAGCLPDGAFDVFGRMVAEGEFRDVMLSWKRELVSQVTAPTDTHPRLADRLARLGGSDLGGDAAVDEGWRDQDGETAETASEESPRTAMALLPVLADRPWQAVLTQTMVSHGRPASRSWEECLRSIEQARGGESTGATLVIQPQADSPHGQGPWPAVEEIWRAMGNLARVMALVAAAVLGIFLGATDHQDRRPQNRLPADGSYWVPSDSWMMSSGRPPLPPLGIQTPHLPSSAWAAVEKGALKALVPNFRLPTLPSTVGQGKK
jgi:Peptidase family M48